MTGVALVVMILAVARLTRLVTSDDITEPWRARLARRSSLTRPSLIVRLVNCNWCTSFWIALAASLAGRASGLVPTWSMTAWTWLAVAGGAGLVMSWQ